MSIENSRLQILEFDELIDDFNIWFLVDGEIQRCLELILKVHKLFFELEVIVYLLEGLDFEDAKLEMSEFVKVKFKFHLIHIVEFDCEASDQIGYFSAFDFIEQMKLS